MMTTLLSAGLWGMEVREVRCEVDCGEGLPGFSLVGQPDTSVRESRDRLFASIRNSGYGSLNKRITVNLAPADFKKEGGGFDLPIAIGILRGMKRVDEKVDFKDWLICGELGLSGLISPIRGGLAFALHARKLGVKKVLCPFESAPEFMAVGGLEVYGVKSLKQAVGVLEGNSSAETISIQQVASVQGNDFSILKGQHVLRRALEVCAAGGHNFLLTGSPGSGKTLAASCLPSILPPPTEEEQVECSLVHSVAGLIQAGSGLLKERPFRSPHSGISLSALIGGGRNPRPGEISLAHLGVLYLDEIPEFPRMVIESLRQPIEDGKVMVSRVGGSAVFPCKTLLGASMNPCPCGFLGDRVRECKCSPREVQKYQARLSGPLLDRMDLQIPVYSPSFNELQSAESGESSVTIRERVVVARNIQTDRYREAGFMCNAHLNAKAVGQWCLPEEKAWSLLKNAAESLGLSARAVHRIQKVSRTIADLDGSDLIRIHHLAEALQFRKVIQSG